MGLEALETSGFPVRPAITRIQTLDLALKALKQDYCLLRWGYMAVLTTEGSGHPTKIPTYGTPPTAGDFFLMERM